mmetsp:Transcript_4040/g.11301  ORF Transcript_4040/g.11301 Transcript_4040/m.11301 type:complete len:255 (-) Transcript_4040:769-1533(-)|eukprot:CAMPEP_0119158604 /NCGR_PEP_ID=MMETSP1310-20130426/53343_1 /TAXON_ID=464262 /ORGANISM="Genus nov. species nov., Strain RCC2339" /LENGTH=254 /DNA_ID=CAMNT_0007151229 /DNA_START=344 /DNA_END=1108 /DNA_ORIENTATION=+
MAYTVEEGQEGTTKTGVPAQAWSLENFPKITDVVTDETLAASFVQFAKAGMCYEFFRFYEDAEHFRSLKTSEELTTHFNRMVATYFAPGAKYRLNLNASITRRVLQNSQTPLPTSFDFAVRHVQSNMSRDALPRYLSSPYYRDYLRHRPDSRSEEFSRKKATDFFGEAIIGPLHRNELVTSDKRSAFIFTKRQKRANLGRANWRLNSSDTNQELLKGSGSSKELLSSSGSRQMLLEAQFDYSAPHSLPALNLDH